MKRTARVLWVAVFAAAGWGTAQARPAPARWRELRSPHFTVLTDGSASQGRDVARHFELIREVFLQITPRLHVDPPEPVIILAVKNQNDLKQLLPGYWERKGEMRPAGFFVSAENRNYIALRMDATASGGYHVVYHEYIHLLERLNFSRLPTWASEGLAEFYAAARLGASDVELGRPIPSHLALLRQGNWIPLGKLLTADQSSPLYNATDLSSLFYAESWELTHYLMVGDNGAHQKEFFDYLDLYERGVASVTAAERAFGDLAALTKRLQHYPDQFSFGYLHAKTKLGSTKEALPARVLTPAETEAAIGDFLVRSRRPVEARAALDEAIRLDPKLPAAYASLGLLALGEHDEAAAKRWLDDAVARGSNDYLVYYYRATLEVGPLGMGDWAAAASDLSRCVALNQNFAYGYQLLAEIYASHNEKLELANSLAQRALAIDSASPLNHLTFGLVLLRQRKQEQAEAEGNIALSLAASEVERERVERFLFTVQQARARTLAQAPEAGARQVAPTGGSGSATRAAPTTKSEGAGPASSARPGPGASERPQTAPAPHGQIFLIAEATVIQASCSSPAPAPANGGATSAKSLSLSLAVRDWKVDLFAPDIDGVGVEGFPKSPSARPGELGRGESTTNSSLCSLPARSHVAVWFRRAPGKPYYGTIVGVYWKR